MTSGASKLWYLYVLECVGDRLYTGISVDPAARYAAHAAGRGAKFTRSFPPIRLLHTECHSGRADALRAEHAFKKLTARQKRLHIGENVDEKESGNDER